MTVLLRYSLLAVCLLMLGSSGVALEVEIDTRIFDSRHDYVPRTLEVSGSANGGNDTTICSLDYQLQGSNTIAGTWDWVEASGQANFFPSNAVADPQVSVPSYGLYTFFWTFTDINACVAVGQVDVDFREQPSAQSTDSLFFCQLLDNALDAVPATGGSSGMWDIPTGTFSYNPILADSPIQNNGSFGNYEAIWTVSNSPFCSDSDTTHLIYSAPEQAEIDGFDIQVCGYSESVTALNTFGSWSSPDPELTFTFPNSPTTTANVSSSGAYTIVWTVGSGDCATTDTRTILFHDPSSVSITTTTSVACSSDDINLNATSTNGIGLEWSSSGDGAFSSLNTEASIYMPGANDSINGTVTLTLTNLGTGSCPDATDQITLDIVPAVDVFVPTFGNPICSTSSISINANAPNSGSVTWSTSGDGLFSPNTSVPLVAYTPGANDAINGSVVLTLTAFPQSLVCPVVSSTTTLTLIEPPEAGNNNVFTLCSTGPAIDLFDMLDPIADGGGIFSDLDGSGALTGSTFDPMAAGVGTFNISYTAIGTSPCSDDMSIMSIFVIAGPNAGSDNTGAVCQQAAITDLSNYLSTDAQGNGAWNPHPFLSGSEFDQESAGLGEYTFYYIVPGVIPCVADTAEIQIEVTAGPDAGLDASIIECETSTAIVLFPYLGGSPETGGSWDDVSGSGSLSGSTFDASMAGAGIYLFDYVVSLAGCTADTSTLTVEVLPAPSVEMSSFPASICSSDTIFLEALANNTDVVSWTSSGTGDFENNNSLVTYYLPAQSDIDAGEVDISITGSGDSSCLDAMEVETISIVLGPTSNAGADASTCGLDYTFTASPSIGTGEWSGPPGIDYGNEPNATVTVPSPGIYTFTWTETNQGCTDSDEVTIEFLSSPVITSYIENCVNTNIEFVVVVQLEGGDQSTYEFNMGGTLIGNEFTSDPIPTGTPYSIAVWDANQCDTFLLEEVFTCPVLTEAGSFDTNPLNYCVGDEIIAPFNNDEFLDANDALMFILHDSNPGIGTVISTSITPEFSFQPGMLFDVTYYVSAVAGDDIGGGLVDLDHPSTVISEPVPLTFFNNPTATVLTSTPGICPGDSTLIELSFTGTPAFDLTYEIDGSETQLTFDDDEAFFYLTEPGLLEIISLEDAHCISLTDTSLNIVTFDLPSAVLADSMFMCSAELEEILVSLEGDGPWSYGVLYNDEPYLTQTSIDNQGAFIPNESGTYTIVDLVDSNCQNPDSASIEVIVTQSPIADAGPDIVICAAEAITIGAEAQFNTSYSWSNPSTLLNPGQSSTQLLPLALSNEVQVMDYILTAEFMACLSIDSTQVIINPIPLQYGIEGTTDVCAGESTSLTAFGGSSYLWMDNGTIESSMSASTIVFPDQELNYMVEISNSFGCFVMDSILVTVHEPLVPLATAIITDPCPPAQVLWVNETEGELSDCDWSFSEGTILSEDCSIADLEYLEPGLQSGFLSVTSIYGCESTASTDTVEIFSGEAEFSYSPSTLSIDDSLLYVFDISNDSASQLWLLNGDTAGFGAEASLSLEGLRPDFYEVCLIMITNNACIDTTCYEFELDNPVAVFVPNSFTPDADGLNDEFRAVIHGWEYVKYFDLSVYDRKGHVIFNSQDPNDGWDGINKRDKTIAQGLYEWVLEIDVFGEAYPRRYIGTLTVLK